ncbi:MAG: type II toxin-antitoxin system HigB family toxin [Candidatus Sericytochromatia bacterium]|nr:type II toxin-antitoxin system HigB family toxin [Candidatus Sericytochromatia bacterium]
MGPGRSPRLPRREVPGNRLAVSSAAQKPLEAWFKIVSQASWSNFVELRQTFPSADLVGLLTVFNLGRT